MNIDSLLSSIDDVEVNNVTQTADLLGMVNAVPDATTVDAPIQTFTVPRDPTMGPATGAEITAFLLAKANG